MFKVLKIVVTGLTIVGVIIVGVNVFAGVLLGNCEFSEFFGPYFPFLISVITSSNLSLLFMSAPLISNISKPNPEDKSILNPYFITGLTDAEGSFSVNKAIDVFVSNNHRTEQGLSELDKIHKSMNSYRKLSGKVE
ncbi:hypothetical protein HOY80DRAFT_52291 [Tuber brumale]|nr:hypothetical protein HOY80DRAFT_52291 [Tuber brumale]